MSSHLSSHRVEPIGTTSTLVAEQSFCSFSLIHDHWLARIVQQLDAVAFFGQRHEEQRRSICNRVINFCLFVVPWLPLLFLQFCSRAILQEITPKREQVCFYVYCGDAASFHEWGNFAPLAGPVTSSQRQCHKSVTDYVEMHLLQHKKLALIIYAKSLTEHLTASTH